MDYKSTQFAYSGDTLIYIGKHWQTNASDADPNWIITKFTYDGTKISKIQTSEGTWSGRASLNW